MRPCLGCGHLIERGSRCADCTTRSADHRRSASQRGYDAAWRAIRIAHLALEPECRFCGAPATDVDHIVTLRSGGTHDDDNLRSLCHSCHSRRTGKDRRLL